ncbi:MAG: hypothetical protein VYC15_04825 [Pseudomonadota bacterium]|nr:hypothetical protein [Pseudomonadota bacterium]
MKKEKYFWLIPAIILSLLIIRSLDVGDHVKAEKMLQEKHPDYEHIRNSDAFHNWVSEQSQDIQDWTYNNPFNAESAIAVLDLYKKDNPSESKGLGCLDGDCINGKGTYFVDVTNDYTGEFKNGKFNGLGVWSTIKDNGLFRASGTFKDNKPIDITWWKLLQIGLLDENHSWFYSGDSIEMKGDYLYVVDLDSYSSQSMTNQIQIDCKASKVRPIETAFYMDVMALGEPFQIVPDDQIPMPPEWLDIDSTPKTHLFRSLCEVYSEEIDETISSST